MDSPDHGHDVREQPSLPSLAPRRDGAVAPRHVSATAAAPQVATRPAAPPATKPLLARRRKVVAACDTCRNRKAKCDGTRPRCRTCIDHGRRCEFFTEPDESRQAATRRHQARSAEQLHQLQTDHDALQDFVHDLVSQPDPAEVQRILAQFCHGSRPAYVPQASPGLLAGVCSSHGLQEHGTQDGLAANASAAAAAPLRGLGRPPRAPLAPALPPRRRTSSTASKRKRSASPPPYKKLFDLLVKSSPDDAMSIFQRARRTGDVVTVLSQAKEADLLLQLHVVPETRRRYDLPLRSDMPDFLLTADNPYLDTPIHDSYFARPPATTSPSASLIARHVGFGNNNNNNNNNNNKIHHVTPFGSAELHEPTLDDIKPSAWTTVLDEDLVLRRLLRSYFLYDYQNYPAFHKDLFLQDMKRGRRRFCSPLLVNAVLAAAAHADSGVPNSDKFWLPQGLAYRFLAEAKRLWDMEDHGIIKLTTMQAAIILNAISLTDTTDKIGMAFLRQAVDMAEGMKLMTTRDDEISSRSMRKARAVTAWCLFSWDVIQSFFFFKKPMFKSPPLHALPETNHQEWYGEIWLRYPGDQNQLTPAYAGAVFSASMGLRKIQHAISVAFFERPKGDPRPSAQDVAKFFGYTYRWFDALPENISPKNTVLPTHLRLHMEYYTALITLARVQPASIASSGEPLEQKRSEFADPSESHLPAPESAVKDPMAHALVCLETLVRIYQMRHGITFYDSSMCYYLAFMGACIIQALGEYYTALAASASPASGDVSSIDLPSRARLEAYRSTLIMCAKGLHELGKSAYVCQVTYYILRDTMSARERTIILSHLKEYSAAASHASSGADDSNESDSGDGEVEGEQSFNEGDSSDQQSGPGPPGSKKVRVKREEEDTIEMRIRKYNQSQFPMPTISIVEDPKNHTLTELAVRYRRMSSGECSETGKSDDEDAGGESPMSD